MEYLLHTFDEFVFGQLDTTSNQISTTHYVEYLHRKYPFCDLVTIGFFTEYENQWHLNKRKELCCLHPEVKRFSTEQLNIFDNYECVEVNPDCYKLLNINSDHVKRIIVKKSKKHLMVHFVESCRWSELSEKNLRYYYYCALLKEEKDQVIKCIKGTVFRINSSKEIRLFIHKIHQSILSLCTKVLHQITSKNRSRVCKIRFEYEDQDIVCLIYHYLIKILRFLERNYRNFLGPDLTIPYRSCIFEDSAINEKLIFLKNRLQQTKLNPELIAILVNAFEKFSSIGPLSQITYAELNYCDMLVCRLNDELLKKPGLTEPRFITILIQLNFNSPDLLPYLIEHYGNNAINEAHNQNNLHKLYKLQKNINQLHPCQHLALIPTQPDLKTQLVNWIDEEIVYYHLLCQYPKGALSEESGQVFHEKLSLNVSVSELALLFKVFYDTGLFETKNQSELFTFIAANLKSKRQSNISVQSIRQRYYNPDNAAIKSLINQIRCVLNSLESL